MQLLQVTIFLLLCSVALGWVARRAGVPYPIALVVGGGLLGFMPGLPQMDFDPQFLLVLVLPPILYQAALLTSWRDFKANARPIGLLAFGLVMATTLAVGATLKLLIPDIPWAAAFAFGAIVSPPDAVAATAILSRLNIPRRIVVVLEGESLVNDASGLVLYKFAVAAVFTGAFSLFDAAWQFVLVAAGGVAVGLLIAWLFLRIHRHLGDAFIEVLVSLSVPYIIYILAESVHLSGVLGVVAAGIYRARHTPVMVSAEMRILARSVWNILVFLLNSLIFILIGLQLSGILGRMARTTANELVLFSLTLGVAAIAVRFLWVYPASYLPRLFARGKGAGEARPPAGELFILSWCGMRGIVSLAAALALPVTIESGAPFPYRDHIVFFTFAVILMTLVAQGLTLSPLIRRLGLGTDWTGIEEERHARADLGRAAIAAVDVAAAEHRAPPALAARIRAEFAEKILEAEPAGAEEQAEADIAKRLRIAALSAERAELIRIWRLNHISDEVLHQLEEELDYREQESRV
jgi:CPA1 family monovalent cation:H+ antiporter